MNELYQNHLYKDKARDLYLQLIEGYNYLSHHKLSIGSWGEGILRSFFFFFLPDNINVAQGFICDNYVWNFDTTKFYKSLDEDTKYGHSPQCDIIIYKGNNDSLKHFGDIYIVPSSLVLAVIEVKTTITNPTFKTTLNNFSVLHNKYGVENMFLFFFNNRTPMTIENYFWETSSHSYEMDGITTGVSTKYDYDNFTELPRGIVCLAGNYYLFKDYVIGNRDMMGYNAYSFSYEDDENNKSFISCLQLFLADLYNLIEGDNSIFPNSSLGSINRLYSIGLFDL